VSRPPWVSRASFSFASTVVSPDLVFQPFAFSRRYSVVALFISDASKRSRHPSVIADQLDGWWTDADLVAAVRHCADRPTTSRQSQVSNDVMLSDDLEACLTSGVPRIFFSGVEREGRTETRRAHAW